MFDEARPFGQQTEAKDVIALRKLRPKESLAQEWRCAAIESRVEADEPLAAH